MHRRFPNEVACRLALRALAIISPCLREEEQGDAFEEFYYAFEEEILIYEQERQLKEATPRGCACAETRDVNAPSGGRLNSNYIGTDL